MEGERSHPCAIPASHNILRTDYRNFKIKFKLENQSFKNKPNIKVNLLSGVTRKNESYLSWKADAVTKTRNHRTEEAWLISLKSGISSFFVKRLDGISMYPRMQSGITVAYNMTRATLMGKDS